MARNLMEEVNELKDRCEQLEQLCRDMWDAYSDKAEQSFHPSWDVDGKLMARMDALGLLEDD